MRDQDISAEAGWNASAPPDRFINRTGNIVNNDDPEGFVVIQDGLDPDRNRSARSQRQLEAPGRKGAK
ncbi:hypothetical protein [Hoeflea prorocentri]|uniref:Uncharacterized protein n=1 Tax=Hoeflea prorocentri TaxID=1922333 RepID=A0A9X3ZJ27_9HYPH|nr:hypothetical protein [Hoeflea prorocentri]MCY6383039.1 hypothetical protein [Hoeflea prorocentri]MDA5400839.1 hypothetical protein [Hoeflea prorocentri]